jgi:two-component system phosphate regulon sensor histidine kinase PhoR
MRRQTERMRTLIEALLQLSRLENSSDAVENQRVDVPGLLSLIRKDVLSLSERPHEINLNIETDVCLLGSETELQSVFVNLISNAVKYTPAEGSVTIRWWRDVTGAHLEVSDTGIGIAPEYLPRLTERFYRVDEGRSRAKGGFGLGLAIVKHALQRHDAQLAVTSQLGKGSVFTCHFPVERIAARVYPAAAASSH